MVNRSSEAPAPPVSPDVGKTPPPITATKPDRASKNRSSDSGGHGASPRTAPSCALRLMTQAGFLATMNSRLLAASNVIGKLPARPGEPSLPETFTARLFQCPNTVPSAVDRLPAGTVAKIASSVGLRSPPAFAARRTSGGAACCRASDLVRPLGPSPPKLTQILPSGATRTLSASAPTCHRGRGLRKRRASYRFSFAVVSGREIGRSRRPRRHPAGREVRRTPPCVFPLRSRSVRSYRSRRRR